MIERYCMEWIGKIVMFNMVKWKRHRWGRALWTQGRRFMEHKARTYLVHLTSLKRFQLEIPQTMERGDCKEPNM